MHKIDQILKVYTDKYPDRKESDGYAFILGAMSAVISDEDVARISQVVKDFA